MRESSPIARSAWVSNDWPKSDARWNRPDLERARAGGRWKCVATVIVAGFLTPAIGAGVVSEVLAKFPGSAATQKTEHPGQELYRRHCESCHGSRGDGWGPAARYVYPLPRNLRTGQFRLVSRTNYQPGREDIARVLEQGMPGSAMMAFRSLNDSDRTKLVDYVMQLRRDGLSEAVIERWRAWEVPFESSDVDAFVADRLKPAPQLTVGPISETNRQAIERGRELYRLHVCQTCHGSDGRGARDLPLYDEDDQLVRPRDLVYEPFKGGRSVESIYRRIRLGMPGSPMPTHMNLNDAEMSDLIAYVMSLSREPKRILTNHQRRQLVVDNAYLDQSPIQPEPDRKRTPTVRSEY